MRHRQQKVVAIGEDLNDQRQGIEAAESELDATDRSIDDAGSRVRELDARITAIEHEHPGGIPDSIRPEYARLVAEHNDAVALHNDLVARQRRLHDDYKAQVDRHNPRPGEANAYAPPSAPCAFLPLCLRARAGVETYSAP